MKNPDFATSGTCFKMAHRVCSSKLFCLFYIQRNSFRHYSLFGSLVLNQVSRVSSNVLGVRRQLKDLGRRERIFNLARGFSSDGEDDKDVEQSPAEEHESVEEGELDLVPYMPKRRGGELAAMSVPEDFPNVPLLALTRHPIFPKFVRLLEVCLAHLSCASHSSHVTLMHLSLIHI